MIRPGPTLALLLACLPAAGCVYDLSVAGKACDDENPCPAGYTCTPGADGWVCTKGAGDGGLDDGDGSDGGDDATCSEGQTRCSPDLTAIQTCTGGIWDDQACGGDEYCLDTDQAAPACEQPCPTGACPGGTWCNPDNSHCEPRGDCTQPDVDRCNPSQDQVIRCDPESGWDITVAECGADQYCDPFDPGCKDYCDDDAQCGDPDTTCEPSSRKCVPVGLCAESSDCTDGDTCIGGACVPSPETEASAAGQTPDLNCFVGQPSEPPASPETCHLAGHLVDFFSHQEQPGAMGLIVRAHRLSDVLAGRLDAWLDSTAAVAAGATAAQYTLADLPTNTQLVLEVQGRHEPADAGYDTLLTFGLYIRAEDCALGSHDFSAPTLYEANYTSYANPTGVLEDPQRGLLFGRLRDCTLRSIRAGVGGVSMQADLVYYLDDLNIPDVDATETNASGFFIAANALPIRGVAAALVLVQGVPVSLRPRPVRVFPGVASLVVFGRPLDPDSP